MANSFFDRCYQLAFSVAYPMVLQLRRTKLYRYDGVMVAIWFQDKILMVKHSYRDDIMLPGGGVKFREKPNLSVVREMNEELGIVIDASKLKQIEIRGKTIEGRVTTTLFECEIDHLPKLKIDNREIIFAEFVDIRTVETSIQDGLCRDYLIKMKAHYKQHDTVS